MTTTSVTTRFDDVLASEHLADLHTAFGDPNYCDEVPLYSRYDQISFSKDTGDINSAFIELALDFLDRLHNELPIAAGGWVAITVAQDDAQDPVVPSAFVCQQDAAVQLAPLRLVSPPATDFGSYVRDLVRLRKSSWHYSVLEDVRTVLGEVRVFISKKMPPFPVLMR